MSAAFIRVSGAVARFKTGAAGSAPRFDVVSTTSAELRGPGGVLFELENRSADDALEIEPGPAAVTGIDLSSPRGGWIDELAGWVGGPVADGMPRRYKSRPLVRSQRAPLA